MGGPIVFIGAVQLLLAHRKPYILTDLLAGTLRKDKPSRDLEPTGQRMLGPGETFAAHRWHV